MINEAPKTLQPTRGLAWSLPTWFFIFLCVLADMLGIAQVKAQTATAREHQVKAAFLYHFASFVEWPTNAFTNPASPLVIGIIGEDPYGGVLDEFVRNEQIGSHPLRVERFQKVEDIGACHILFISRSEDARLRQILAALKGKSILTVGETGDFAVRGGVIEFVTVSGRVRFRINPGAAKTANLTISSKLLRAAEIVTTERTD